MKDAISEEQILQYFDQTNICYHFHFFDCVSSTNDLAKEMIREEDAAGSVIIANTQSNGRGRNGKSFSCPDGGIYVSCIFTGVQLLHKQQFLLFAPCVAVCLTIDRLLGIQPQIKWPNDILLNGRKICGILTETQMNTGNDNIIIGIGINYLTGIDSFPHDIQATAGTLRDYAQNISRNEFIAELVKTLDELCVTYSEEQYLREYKKRAAILGCDIIIIAGKETIHAKAVDVCDDGGLLIEKKDGKIEKIYAGDVSIQGNYKN